MSALLSKSKADGIFLLLVVIGMMIVYASGMWWPEIVLPIGISLSFKQFLRGRKYEMYLSFFVFTLLYLSSKFKVKWEVLMPILLSTGALYLLFYEFFFPKEKDEVQEEEEMNLKIEENHKDHE